MTKEEQVKLFNEVLEKEAQAILTAQSSISPSEVLEAAFLISDLKGKLLMVAIGKGGYVGQKMSASFASMGIPSFYIHATELFHGDFGRIETDDVIILLSHSGETEEVVKAAEVLKERGNKLIAITKSDKTSLAKLADVSLLYGEFIEADHLNMAPTSSSTVMLAVGDALMVLVSKMISYSAKDFKKNHPGGSLGKKEV